VLVKRSKVVNCSDLRFAMNVVMGEEEEVRRGGKEISREKRGFPGDKVDEAIVGGGQRLDGGMEGEGQSATAVTAPLRTAAGAAAPTSAETGR
jgi:hypothetical protein